MRWLKSYSILLLYLIVGMTILSFFMIDFLPMFYKFHMGVEVSSLKMDKLNSFGFKIISEWRLYLGLSLFTFIAMYLVETLKQYFILLITFLLIHFIFIAEIGEFPIFRRFYLMIVSLPLLWIFFDFFKFKKETYETKITHAFLYITLLAIVLPGLYLPPFFSGIPGWTREIDRNDTFVIEGVFLVRDDGEEIRFSRAIVSPINFVTRLNSYTLRHYPNKVHTLLKFYKTTYIKRYKILEQGLMPHQKFLGSFAYPLHNPYGVFNYSTFPPNRISEIKLSVKHYNWNKKFIKEEILARKSWK